MKLQYYILFVLILGLTNCSSPQKLYEKGKYFKAFDSVLGDLKSGKKTRKNNVLLNKAFSKMIDETRNKLYSLEDGYDVSDLQYNFDQYEEVDSRYSKGRSFLDDDNDLKYEGLRSEKSNLVRNAYEEGKDLMAFFGQSNNKLDARNAFHHFELVEQYGSDYDDIDQLLYDSKSAAMILYHIETDLDSDFSYEWDIDRKFDDLEGESGFVRIYYENNIDYADCYIRLEFSRLDVDERDRSSTQNFSENIIDGYSTKTDTSGNTIETPIYKEVTGSVKAISITKNVEWKVDLKIIKSSINCDMREKRFRADVEDKVEEYEIRGDERAIPQEYKTNSTDRLERTDDMVEDLIDELYTQIRRYIN